MQHSKRNSNAATVFGLDKIPTDNWIHALLDPVTAANLFLVFRRVFERLEKQGCVDSYRDFDRTLLAALDGTWFHSSEAIHCGQCNRQRHPAGRTTWYHQQFQFWAGMEGPARLWRSPEGLMTARERS